MNRSLTDEEVQALPPDGDILGTPCLCATTAYGAVSLFYRPKDVERIYNCCNLGDGLAVLYRNTSKTICLDLVDAAGRRTDHRELMPWDGDTALAVELLPRQRQEDAAFVFTGGPDATARTLVIFRAAEGKLTHLESQTETLFPGGGTGEDIEAALFNQNGTAVMVVRSHNRQAALRDGSYTENGAGLGLSRRQKHPHAGRSYSASSQKAGDNPANRNHLPHWLPPGGVMVKHGPDIPPQGMPGIFQGWRPKWERG